jgi:hypothetical protein
VWDELIGYSMFAIFDVTEMTVRFYKSPAATVKNQRKMEGSDMGTFHEAMNEYRIQLEKGVIQEAYKGLMEYIMGVRMFFNN